MLKACLRHEVRGLSRWFISQSQPPHPAFIAERCSASTATFSRGRRKFRRTQSACFTPPALQQVVERNWAWSGNRKPAEQRHVGDLF